MDDLLRRAAVTRAPYNDGNPGRFGLLPSLLEEFFQPASGEPRGASFALDIEETETAYQLTADLPGLEKSDIAIDLHENILTISAERKEERGTDGRLLWHERPTGKLSRTVQLPQAVDADAVKATYVNGMLQLTMQKLAATKTRKISVA
ncbi:MAG: Hsp20/alpha crystallin family protein [Betaproteobacteria bacterium]|nr:MAG: Hsp20/alpha crystallin family protein [Betaproteobacteria bacterium]